MEITKDDILKLSKLSRLYIGEDDASKYSEQISQLMKHIENIMIVDVEQVEPMSHVFDHGVELREDRKEESLPIDEVIRLAPDANGSFIRVPIIIESE